MKIETIDKELLVNTDITEPDIVRVDIRQVWC